MSNEQPQLPAKPILQSAPFAVAAASPLGALTMQQATAPMTLGNMRQNGVRTLSVHCGGRWCHHQAVLDVSGFPDSVPVPTF
jgi:hypothetical protein